MSKRKIFRELTDVEEARKIFEKHADTSVMDSETINLGDALNRVLAKDVFSTIDVPSFDRSIMDGFAVNSADIEKAEEDKPVELKVIGEAKAGYLFEGDYVKLSCVEISTGAPIPIGFDSVVMVEHTLRKGDIASIFRPTAPGEDIMSAGSDIQEGERIYPALTLLTSRELSVLAALGNPNIEVVKKPKVAIFSSGDEIIELGDKLIPGKIYDINATSISANTLENGGIPVYLGIIKDNHDDIKSKLLETLNNYDLVIISGGTSAGIGDMVYTIMDEIGAPGLLVHGIKVKPGKPTILAVCDNTPIIGLPGNPSSALSILNLFVIPFIRKKAGIPPLSKNTLVQAKIKQRLRSVSGRHEFKPMNLIKSKEGWLSFPVPGGSGAITSIAMADGFVEIPEEYSFIPAESEIEISLLSQNIVPTDLQIIGSHCIAMARIQALMTKYHPEIRSRSIVVGSTGGLASIRRGEAHIAGVHLLDEETGDYNSWIKEKLDVEIIPGYFRMQGFVVAKGNPKGIHTIQDLTKDDVRFLNRNPGSGTRILFDSLIQKENIEPTSIRGYQDYSRSHTTIAAAVRSGKVDVGVAIEIVAGDDLDFIPLKEEEYDIIISNTHRELPAVKKFIKILQTEEFRSIIDQLKGYRLK